MKKTLAIFLTLLLIISTVINSSLIIGSATDGVTAASFTDGVTWHLSEGGDIDYLRLTSGWGSFTGANGSVTITDPNSCRSTMANIKGFTAGETYEISFSATGISGVSAVLNYDSAYFNMDQIVTAKSGYESDLISGTVSNNTASITVTPTDDNIYLIVKNKAGTVTLNNFSVNEINDSNMILSDINDGLIWGLSEGGNIDYLRLTSGWGSFTSANGLVTITDPNSCRSTMANVTGFTAGKTYEISFSATGISGVSAVLNYDSAYFNTDQIVTVKSGCESDLVSGTVSNGVATITVTPTDNNIYLIVKNKAGTVTLNNFGVTEINDSKTILSGINDGLTWGLSEGGNIDYLRLTSGWGSFTSSYGSVTITDPNSCRSTMANVTGFTAGETYKLSFGAIGISGVYAVLNYDSAYFNTDQIVTAKSGCESDLVSGTVSNGVATITVTPTDDNIYLIVKNSAGTVTLNNFEVTIIDEEPEGNPIANGEWNITKNAGGTVTKANNTVSFTGAQYQTMYTKLTDLTVNNTYRLTFDVSPSIEAQVWMLSGEAEVTFTIDGTVPSGAVSIGTVNGTSATVDFTAEEASHYIFIRNVGSTTEFTFSSFNFIVKEIGEPTGKDVAGGTWWSTRNATYTSSGTTVTWTTDPSWHSVYTELKGLKPNTKYELAFEHNVADLNQLEVVWLYKGTKNSMTLNSAKDRPAEFTPCTVTKKTGKLIATFTTGEEDSVYCIGMKVGNANGLILSNITFGKWIQREVIADDLVSGQWTLGEGGRSTTDLVGTDGWGKFNGENGTVTIIDPNSCRTSFIKVNGFVSGNTYELTFNATGIEGSSVVLADGSAYIDINYQSLQTVSGMEANVVKATAEGNRYTVQFTAKNDYIYLTVKNNSGTVTLSDFIFDPLRISAGAEWGGTVAISPSDIVAQNTDVTFTATPNIGNYFVGWYDGEALVSAEKSYTVKAESDINLTAVFDGKNTSSDDLFAQRGYDGTFENGTVPGWYATHYNAADANYVSFCNYTTSTRHAYEGSKSLRIQAYHRCSILPITNLKKNTDYRLSFYVYYEDNGTVTTDNNNLGHITANAVIDAQNIHTSTAEKIYTSTQPHRIMPNTGWYRTDLYFNSGDATAVNYLTYYGSDDYSTACIYIDNLTLSEYSGNDTVINSNFSKVCDNNGKAQPEGWITYAEAATEGTNGVLMLQKEEKAYQILNTSTDGLYTVSFRAKGKLRAGAVDLAKGSTNVKNLLSSASYVDASKSVWSNYSFNFYTNNHKAVKLMFEGLENGAMVDDIKITKAEMSAGGIVENIDFESERFALSEDSKQAFSLYTATASKDNNVLSGKYSLKFTPTGDSNSDKFLESYLSFQSVEGVSYTVTFNYKSAAGGSIYLVPDVSEKYCTDQAFYYSLEEKGWQKVQFNFTTLDEYNLKAIMASIAESAKGTVYFDDISIKARMPLIQGYNLEKTYCDALFNAIDYTSFENFKNDGNMGKLPSGLSVIKSDDAPAGNSIMTVKAGSKYIYTFDVEPTKIYQLGVSLKGDSKTKGSVSVSVDAGGKYYYCDEDEIARSKITAPTNGEWIRDGFSFTTSNEGKVYVVIECTSGTMKVDDLMLFKEAYASATDNNDYSVYLPYNYKNPPVKIMNGGLNADGTIWDGTTDGWSGTLGDSTRIEVALAVVIASAAIALTALLIKKRKGEHHA